MHDKDRRGHSQPAIDLSTGKGPKELKEFVLQQEEQHDEPLSTPRAPMDKNINRTVHMVLPMAPDA